MMPVKMQEFKAAGAISFTPPNGVTVVLVTMAGGGGSGGGSAGGAEREGESGGGAGEFVRRVPLHCTPGVAITGTVGAGGPRGIYNIGNIAANGGTTTFGPYICLGGQGGGKNNQGGNVGSLGGGYAAVAGGSISGQDGREAIYEYGSWTAGASGGSVGPNGSASGHLGGPTEGNIAAAAGSRFFDSGSGAFFGGGAGGGACGWGSGGAGGNGNTPGNDAPSGSFGAGGGGGGPYSITGAGSNGYILVEWFGA